MWVVGAGWGGCRPPTRMWRCAHWAHGLVGYPTIRALHAKRTLILAVAALRNKHCPPKNRTGTFEMSSAFRPPSPAPFPQPSPVMQHWDEHRKGQKIAGGRFLLLGVLGDTNGWRAVPLRTQFILSGSSCSCRSRGSTSLGPARRHSLRAPPAPHPLLLQVPWRLFTPGPLGHPSRWTTGGAVWAHVRFGHAAPCGLMCFEHRRAAFLARRGVPWHPTHTPHPLFSFVSLFLILIVGGWARRVPLRGVDRGGQADARASSALRSRHCHTVPFPFL